MKILVGSHGTGKTTLLNTLSGAMPLTEGAVTIYGRDLNSDIGNIRKMLGAM